MCPCPVCATLALLLAPFLGYKWVKNLIKKHHCQCQRCQEAEREKSNTLIHEKNGCNTKCGCHDTITCPANQEQEVVEGTLKRRVGRPKGAKNKVKKQIAQKKIQPKRHVGRPKGTRKTKTINK